MHSISKWHEKSITRTTKLMKLYTLEKKVRKHQNHNKNKIKINLTNWTMKVRTRGSKGGIFLNTPNSNHHKFFKALHVINWAYRCTSKPIWCNIPFCTSNSSFSVAFDWWIIALLTQNLKFWHYIDHLEGTSQNINKIAYISNFLILNMQFKFFFYQYIL